MNNRGSKWLVFACVAIAQFIVILDLTVINVALPVIKVRLHFGNAAIGWVVTAYALTFGGFLLFGGRAADLFGRRRMLLVGTVAFTACSLLVGTSPDPALLVVLRGAQGMSAALMSPAALSIVLTTFGEGPERNRALGYWSAVATGGAAVGLLLGGVLTSYAGWRWNFFINVPVGVVMSVVIARVVPACAPGEARTRLDVPGAALATIGLMAAVFYLSQSPDWGWAGTRTLPALAGALVLLALFVAHEQRAPYPLIPLAIFRNRNLSGANLAMASATHRAAGAHGEETRTMRAALAEELGGIDSVKLGDQPDPAPAAGQVLVRVRGAGVGPWDVGFLSGGFPGLALPFVPGQEVGGVVEAVGDGAGVQPGERVYASLFPAGGGFAELALASADRLAPMPGQASFAEAAGLVIGGGTAYEGLVDRGRLQAGETVLVTAAAGGVGSAAVQIAAGLGARPLGVASPANRGYLRGLGASEVFDYHAADWVQQVRAAIPGGVDLLLDGAGGRTRDQAIGAVRDGGRAIFIVLQGSPARLERGITGESFAAHVNRSRLEALRRLVDAGTLRPQVEAVLPLEQAREALARVAGRHARGKIVLQTGQYRRRLSAKSPARGAAHADPVRGKPVRGRFQRPAR